MAEPALHAAGVARRFGAVPVLAGVDLTVEAGDAVALLGPNGAGKTTLLRLFALLLRPSVGRLALFGGDAAKAPATLRRRIGYVAHESLCYPDLTGAENLAFYAQLYGVGDARRRIEELIAWAGLEAAARRPARAYSRGMLQRLALARALLHAPDLLVLDEPYTGLDPEAATALDARLAALRSQGCAIVFATHDVERAAAVATRVAILHRGRIARESRPEPTAAIAATYRAVTGAR